MNIKLILLTVIAVLLAVLVPPSKAQSDTINIRELGERLSAQTSYRYTFSSQGTAFTGYRVHFPNSWSMEGQEDMLGLNFCSIGARQWVELPGLFVSGCGESVGEPPLTQMIADACDLGKSGIALLEGAVSFVFSDREAEFVEETEHLGIPVYKYQSRDETGALMTYLVDQQSGLPLFVEAADFSMEFGRYNDPANIIMPLADGMPEILVLDDALMQLHAYESFRFVLEAELQSDTVSSYVIEGEYRLGDGAWHALWDWTGSDAPSFELLTDGTTEYIRFEEHENWTPASLLGAEDLFLGAGGKSTVPFYTWGIVPSGMIVFRDAGADRLIEGVSCHGYSGEKQNEQTGAGLSVHICITPDVFPIEIVLGGANPASNFTMRLRQVYAVGPVEIPIP